MKSSTPPIIPSLLLGLSRSYGVQSAKTCLPDWDFNRGFVLAPQIYEDLRRFEESKKKGEKMKTKETGDLPFAKDLPSPKNEDQEVGTKMTPPSSRQKLGAKEEKKHEQQVGSEGVNKGRDGKLE